MFATDTEQQSRTQAAVDITEPSLNSFQPKLRKELRQEPASISAAWLDPAAKDLLTRVLHDGMFRDNPECAVALTSRITELVASNVPDAAIWYDLRECLREQNTRSGAQQSIASDEAQRFERRVAQVGQLIPEASRVLDVGCGNGEISTRLASLWGISAENYLGFEVAYRVTAQENFTARMLSSEGCLPAPVTGDTALLLMVLHHDPDPARLLKSVFDALTPSGQLLIRECDVQTESEKLFHSALDDFYFRVLNPPSGVPLPVQYRSASDWVHLLEEAGFSSITVSHPERDSPIRPVHILAKKTSGTPLPE